MLEHAGRGELQEFFAWALGQFRPGTVAVRHRSLSALYSWAEAEGIVERSPMRGLPVPTVPEHEVPVVPDEDIRRLLKACSTERDIWGRRDEAVVRVLVETGLRVGEAAGIRTDELDRDGMTILVARTKTSRDRRVAYGPATATALERYLRLRRGHRLAHLPRLWIGSRGSHLTANGIDQMLRRRCAQAGLEPINPHRLRHTAAAYLAAAGAGDDAMLRTFGWRSRDMLHRYGSATSQARALDVQRRLDAGGRF